MPKKKKKRGGASLPCPTCGKDTHVIVTRRGEGKVIRFRGCLKHEAHRFYTCEIASTDPALYAEYNSYRGA
jgi:transcriptional regulator NrdR family protein